MWSIYFYFLEGQSVLPVCKYRSCFCSYAELIRPARQRIRRRHKSKHRSVFVSTGTFRCATVGPSPLRALHQDELPDIYYESSSKTCEQVWYISVTIISPRLCTSSFINRNKSLGLPCICLIANSISTASSIFQTSIHILLFLMVCSPLNFWLNIQGAFYVCVQFSLIFFSFSFKLNNVCFII